MSALSHFFHAELRPPRFLSQPTFGIDISTSTIKIAGIEEKYHGLVLSEYGELTLPAGSIARGEIVDRPAVVAGLKKIAKQHHITVANVALPEARGYLFEVDLKEKLFKEEQRLAIERHLDEYVPIPSAEVVFDIANVADGEDTRIVGMGYSRRVIEETLSVVEEAGITVRAIESETFALPRVLLPHQGDETTLFIDLGKMTTKLLIAGNHLPRYVTTLEIGGHALTLAIQKYFGVSEDEAKRVKAERGIVPGEENVEYVTAMMSTVSVIRDEILQRFEYWQSHTETGSGHTPITRAVLIGGNASILGLPEYLEVALKVPVQLGDMFVNFASRETWTPPLPYMESLAYGTVLGLALREYVK